MPRISNAVRTSSFVGATTGMIELMNEFVMLEVRAEIETGVGILKRAR